MITFFAHCRPFVGEFKAIQETAIRSWMGIPDAQIVLVGVEGEHAANRLGIDYAPVVEYNEHGTALVNSVFAAGERMAKHEWLCEISSDIVMSAAIVRVAKLVESLQRPFIVGRRWDIDPLAPVSSATLHKGSAMDYFLYKRGTLGEMPPFAIGRQAYDQWLMYAAMELWDMDVIDATLAIKPIHINHGYPEYGTREKLVMSDEVAENRRIGGLDSRWYETTDSVWYVDAKATTILERET